MAEKTAKKYTYAGLQVVIALLQVWSAAAEESLGREEEKDTPNDERLDRYNDRLECLEHAIEALEAIEQ